MVTLQENAVKFNNDLIVSHDGGRLSTDSGLILIDELMDAFAFTQLSEAIVLFREDRKYWEHSNDKILKQLVL
ncbi:transposase, partial [Clostridium sp. ZBS17]|uniref:transposase n=1 Tax=Clostridium sp. ZBS17 TaxID=2949968 RepID=UPI002079BA4B